MSDSRDQEQACGRMERHGLFRVTEGDRSLVNLPKLLTVALAPLAYRGFPGSRRAVIVPKGNPRCIQYRLDLDWLPAPFRSRPGNKRQVIDLFDQQRLAGAVTAHKDGDAFTKREVNSGTQCARTDSRACQ